MAFTGRSAITLHIYEYKSIVEAIEMTLSLSSRRLGLEHARNGAPKVRRGLAFLDLELLRAY